MKHSRFVLLCAAIFPACAQSVVMSNPVMPEPPRTLPPPAYQEPSGTPLRLPPVEPLPQEENRLSSQLRVFVKAYRFTGNTAVSTGELENLAAPYSGKTVTSEDLEELRHKISLYYVNKGYINSGAVLPDQKIEDHVVLFRIVEGRLNAINISGTQRLNEDYVRSRLLPGAVSPLNVNALQQRLVLLQQKGLLERINAQLQPGTTPGESSLDVAVKEALPYQAGFNFSNHFSPSVGPLHLEGYVTHRNLTGAGDEVDVKYGLTQGIHDYSFRYARPLDAHDTTVGMHVSQNNSSVIEAPFNQLNITSRSQTKGIDLSRSFMETPNEKLILGLTFENRDSQSYLFGIPFSFSAGEVNGGISESVGRFSQEWVRKEPAKALTLRSTLSVGSTNAAPKVGNIGPDRDFVSWLGQWQWAQKLDGGKQIILLANVQWTSQTLVTLEKFGIGGANTVRGYRETQLLRDKGAVVSAEYRLPVFFDNAGISRTQLAAFIDYGQGQNTDKTADVPRDILGAGLGILWSPTPHWQAQTYVGHAFTNFPVSGTRDLQDMGIHFQINYQMF